jgi:hypothetical protein
MKDNKVFVLDPQELTSQAQEGKAAREGSAPREVWLVMDPTDDHSASLAYPSRALADHDLSLNPERDRIAGPYVLATVTASDEVRARALLRYMGAREPDSVTPWHLVVGASDGNYDADLPEDIEQHIASLLAAIRAERDAAHRAEVEAARVEAYERAAVEAEDWDGQVPNCLMLGDAIRALGAVK